MEEEEYYFNPMLASDADVNKERVKEENMYVTVKGDDGQYYYVLSDGMQTTMDEIGKGKKVNMKNHVANVAEEFNVGGKKYYGVNMEKGSPNTIGNHDDYDMVRWEIDYDNKTVRYRGGSTELSKVYKNKDILKGTLDNIEDFDYVEDNDDVYNRTVQISSRNYI